MYQATATVIIIIIIIIIDFYIPLTCANTSERSAGSRDWYLGPSWVFSCASDRPFVIERQVCSLSANNDDDCYLIQQSMG